MPLPAQKSPKRNKGSHCPLIGRPECNYGCPNLYLWSLTPSQSKTASVKYFSRQSNAAIPSMPRSQVSCRFAIWRVAMMSFSRSSDKSNSPSRYCHAGAVADAVHRRREDQSHHFNGAIPSLEREVGTSVQQRGGGQLPALQQKALRCPPDHENAALRGKLTQES